MDLWQFLSATQVADLKAIAKAIEEANKIELKAVPIDLPSFSYDYALLHRMF